MTRFRTLPLSVIAVMAFITLSPSWRARGHDASLSPVHQWVADQAKMLWSTSEIRDNLPQSWSDNVATLDSYAILYGTRYEDDEYSAEFSGCWASHPYCNHFWNPMNSDDLYDEGLVYGGRQWQSAYRRAQTLWDSHVIGAYAQGRIPEAYEWLGRVVHLLTDMSVPAHVNKVSASWGRFDIHIPGIDPDSYEDYVKASFNYKMWPANGSMRYAPTLYELFRSMAGTAKRFDSNDADGYEDLGTRRMGGLTTEELREIGDVLMPEAIRHVAGLYHLFWDLAHCAYGVGSGTNAYQSLVEAYDRNGGLDYVGCAVSTGRAWGSGYVQEFSGGLGGEGALLSGDGAASAFWVHGPIWTKYGSLGGPTGLLGYPLSDESEDIPSVLTGARIRYNAFVGGYIGHHATGPRAGLTVWMGNGILGKWSDLGSGNSPLGIPIGDEGVAATSPFGTTGRVCEFEGGHIHWHGSGSRRDLAYETHGAIDSLYISMGGTASWLGFPISDQYTAATGYQRSDFEGGYITTPNGVDYHAYPLCQSPGRPSNPSPPNWTVGVSVDPILGWDTCANADSYDVHFGTSPSPAFLQNTTDNSYALSGLRYGTRYYWKVVARNSCGNETSGPLWSFVTGSAPDVSPPSPNPMAWSTAPYAVGTGAIAMLAATAVDNTPPVSYYFEFVESPTGGTGGADSGWKESPFYTNSGLQANHRYAYRVKARDSAPIPNETSYSSLIDACTLANSPGAAPFSGVTQTTVRANWTPNGNRPGTEYLCENVTTGTTSGWLAGTHWDSTGLTPATSYSFRVKARNGDGIESDWTNLGHQVTAGGAEVEGPLVTVTSHSDGQHVSTFSITLSGTASDAGRGDNGIQQVLVNGSRAANDTASGGGTANWSRSLVLTHGANTVTVTAFDDSPNHNQTSQSMTIYCEASSNVYLLTVSSSNPERGVAISVSPADRHGHGDGSTPFTRVYEGGAAVALSAPSLINGRGFQGWQLDGADYGADRTIVVPMDADHTVTAVYSLAPDRAIELPETGQTDCYDDSGRIPCLGTGQDGDLRAGVAWPSPRFLDEGDGSILDRLTGLVWLRDAGTPTVGPCDGGPMDWRGALDYVACLNEIEHLGHVDWRLPNTTELGSLMNAGEWDSAIWLHGEGFTGVQSGQPYWSSTTVAGMADHAWIADLSYGQSYYLGKSGLAFAWPVRSGEEGSQVNAEPWKTGQRMSYEGGDDGDLQEGIEWPDPRFEDNADGTVTDCLTGLLWTKDAYTPGPSSCGPAMWKTWQEALDHVQCLNLNKYLGFSDWRLPNKKELFSLVDHSKFYPALPAGHPFENVTPLYWSSTTGLDPAWGFMADLDRGGMLLEEKLESLCVWPVRSSAGADTIGPSVAITSHVDGEEVGTCALTLRGTASDAGRGGNGVQKVTVNGNRAESDTTTGSGVANWSAAVCLGQGPNELKVTAYDDSPNHNHSTRCITIHCRALGGPDPPTGVSASDGTYTEKVEVTWDPSPGATSYEVWRNPVEETATAIQLAGSVAQVRYDDWAAEAGTCYYYWVKAKNHLGTSGFSESDSGYRAMGTPRKVEPAVGTVGTELTITGEGFGTKRGRVYIGGVACKVLSWSDTSIRCRVTKPLPAGSHAVGIEPKGGSAIVMDSAFTVRPPEIDSVEPPYGSAGGRIMIQGRFFGTKKPGVSLGTKKCKVLSSTMNSATGVSSVVFLVPKGLAPGTYDLVLTNQIGSVTRTAGFVVN